MEHEEGGHREEQGGAWRAPWPRCRVEQKLGALRQVEQKQGALVSRVRHRVPKLQGCSRFVENRGSFGGHRCKPELNSNPVNLQDRSIWRGRLRTALWSVWEMWVPHVGVPFHPLS
jgi:hypothetical protein